ncbi:GIY-YIG nuclease family protein [Tissierella creatinini]|nr:GIY-YIG nuclease family protein [Tissierella creatinini]TJX66719.1 GIY-YIG nuclease family protein [Soehngenia saccharolytica]
MHYVYIVRCIDDTLYTGYTIDMEKRIKAHNKGNGAKYTRGRLPVKLCFYEEYDTKSEAMRREYKIKHLSRKKKLDLIGGNNK